MCLGVYSCKKVLTHVLRKMKASSTNWLIWIISLKPCFANILSRKCQIRNRDTLNEQPPKKLKSYLLLQFSNFCVRLQRSKTNKFSRYFFFKICSRRLKTQNNEITKFGRPSKKLSHTTIYKLSFHFILHMEAKDLMNNFSRRFLLNYWVPFFIWKL